LMLSHGWQAITRASPSRDNRLDIVSQPTRILRKRLFRDALKDGDVPVFASNAAEISFQTSSAAVVWLVPTPTALASPFVSPIAWAVDLLLRF
jgi:hypothetical protein